jgi:hypothetical protein
MTTSTTTDISNLIRKSLPGRATAGQLSTLTERFGERYEWGWICGDGSAGGAHSRRGAKKAASRAAGRAARACGGPAPWTCIVDLDAAVGGTADDMTHAYDTTRTADGVRYWQVHEQNWRTVHAQSEIPARDWPTMSDTDRAMFRELELEPEEAAAR